MKVASITETKNNLSALLDLVRGGQTILVLDRDTPVAEIRPVSAELLESDPTGRIARLVKAGVATPGSGKKPDMSSWKPLRMRRGSSALAALLEEREENER